MDRQNMRNPDDKVAQYLNCHAKQSAMEGPYLQGHGKQDVTKQIRDSKTQ
jgi:hypothetical protein